MRKRDADRYSYEGGNIADGVRRVRTGGRVKFDGFWHQSEFLVPYVGKLVRVSATDAFYSDYVAVSHYHGGWICNAINERGEHTTASR